MERNFFRRVEVAFPILERELRDSIIADLQLYLRDDRQAWLLDATGRYARVLPPGQGHTSAQQELIDHYTAAAAQGSLTT
jgi:polyphosphate kinase